MGKLYLGNAFSSGMLLNILSDDNTVSVKFKKISLDEVKEILKTNDFTSIIGHESTAEVLSTLLDMEIPTNRINVRLEKGDTIIVFQLNQRLPENVVLDKDELMKLDFTFILGTVLIEN
jgi:hypothetical protein